MFLASTKYIWNYFFDSKETAMIEIPLKINFGKEMKKPILLYLFFLITNNTMPSSVESLLKQSTLDDRAKVQQLLFEQGFQKIYFTTEDNFKICGLFLDQSGIKKIKGTIIFCAGFYPGAKEGMASFYALINKEPYNFLLFDARGHQESEGSLFSYSNLKQYGMSEYQDIIAAIKFLDDYNAKHSISQCIVIHGICSGAFHAIKALDYLSSNKCPECKNIKGIIFDSGWFHITDIIEPTIQAELNKRLLNSYFSFLIRPILWITTQFYKLFLKNSHEKIPGISEPIKNTPCPLFFVHCTNDPYVPIQPIKKLTTDSNWPHTWWITHNRHVDYHLTNPDEYRTKLIDFLNTALNK